MFDCSNNASAYLLLMQEDKNMIVAKRPFQSFKYPAMHYDVPYYCTVLKPQMNSWSTTMHSVKVVEQTINLSPN